MTVGQATSYVMSGMYGEVGFVNSILLIVQLCFAGLIVLYLDEMLQNGYGLGSGISLFIATNICENVLWTSLSPITIKSDNNTEFEGAIVALFHMVTTRKDKGAALYHAFWRGNAPNMANLSATFIICLLVIYFQGFKVNVPLTHRKVRGYQQNHKIKLFYTSTFPIILQAAVISNLYFFSQILDRRFRGNFFIGLLGRWKDVDFGNQSVPIGGLAYYISPPRDFTAILGDPLHGITYAVFVMASCAILARLWLEISG